MNYVRVKLRLETLAPGQVLEAFVDDGAAARNVPRSAREEGHERDACGDRSGAAPDAKARGTHDACLHDQVEAQLVAARRIRHGRAMRGVGQAALALRIAEVAEVGVAVHARIVAAGRTAP